MRYALVVARFPEEYPIVSSLPLKIFLFEPAWRFLLVSSPGPLPQTSEDGVINMVKGAFTHHVPVIIDPTPFDLSSIPAGYTGSNIAKATLKLYVSSVTTAGSFNVDLVNGNWSENTLNANNAPALGATIAASVPLTKSRVRDYILIDITQALQDWLNGTPNDGIALVPNSPFAATFESKENIKESHNAELDVVFAGGGAITGVLTGAGSGLTGGGTSGTLNLSLLTTCTSGQTLSWNGSAWGCQTVKGTGTVTSVGLSAPVSDFVVSGSPITTSGTLNIVWNVTPDSHNTANAIVKRDSTGSFNATSINASGQISVNNGSSLNPIISQASAANAAAIVGYSVGTGLTNGVFGSTVSSTQAYQHPWRPGMQR